MAQDSNPLLQKAIKYTMPLFFWGAGTQVTKKASQTVCQMNHWWNESHDSWWKESCHSVPWSVSCFCLWHYKDSVHMLWLFGTSQNGDSWHLTILLKSSEMATQK